MCAMACHLDAWAGWAGFTAVHDVVGITNSPFQDAQWRRCDHLMIFIGTADFEFHPDYSKAAGRNSRFIERLRHVQCPGVKTNLFNLLS